MSTTITATHFSVSWSARGHPHVDACRPFRPLLDVELNRLLFLPPLHLRFALHSPPAQAEDPQGDAGSCPGAVDLGEPDLGSQHRARVACRWSGGRIASNERAMQDPSVRW
jgi:hypothetical protein